MDIEAQTAKNAESISSLALIVTELSTTVKYEAEIAKGDRSSVKDMVNELKSLNEKITSIAGVQKEQAQAAKEISQLSAYVENIRDWKAKFDLSNMLTRIEGLEKKDIKDDGVKEAVSVGADWFWRIFGPALSALTVAVIAWYFSQGNVAYRHTEETYTGKTIHGAITGE